MIADKIKALREAAGLTQAELARALSLTRGGVNSWEQGLSTPSPASIVEIARFFSVSTDYLLGVDDGATISVKGLNDKNVALLTELVRQLKEKEES